ncbi:hypothetical protein [Corynebacterium provencense]|uniref:hypothetical protein n=1 Tax=Corynebacterium provencense TaxID=1737425 RepID=UPI0008328AE8|nr:hypothetical protein [Corynebacterium provencense]
MTDITDPQAKFLTAFARGVAARPGSYSDDLVESAKAVLATVDDPASTLVGELRGWERIFRDEGRSVDARSMQDLAVLAEQVEQERDEARAAAKTWQEQDENDCEMYSEDVADLLVTLAETRAEVERWKKAEREASEERDDAEAEVEQLRAARERLNAEVERLTAEQAYWKEYALERQRVVERLVAGGNAATIASEANVAPDQQANPDPADVPSGEPWIVEVDGERRTAVRAAQYHRPWSTFREAGSVVFEKDPEITLVSRFVPAPRVITDSEELEQLAATSIIRDGRGWPGGITDQGVTMINGACLSDEEVLSHGPVTVLWEAES